MKMKKLYCFAALCAGAFLFSTQSMAQDRVVADQETISVTEFSCDNTNRYFASWQDNWFIQLGAGVNQPFVESGVGAESGVSDVHHSKMTATYNFGFGRWFSPYLGFRFNALGGALHWDNPTAERPLDGWSKAKHVNLNLELMWDMFNSFGGVNENRVFSIIPFVGVGGDYTWHIHDANGNPAAATNVYNEDGSPKTNSWTLPVTVGMQFRFRLCKYVDFFAEARASFYGDNWNNCTLGKPIESNVAVLGGFNINVGGRGWKNYNECDYISQLALANNQINALRSDLLATSQALAAAEAQLPCPEVETEIRTIVKDCTNAPLMATVRFDIDSDVISSHEEVNIYNMAKWLKDNPKEKVVIVGYADRDTGTAEYNMALSERRANVVADALVKHYGIDRSRLTVKYDGSDVQPYKTNDWNRIVIFKQ